MSLSEMCGVCQYPMTSHHWACAVGGRVARDAKAKAAAERPCPNKTCGKMNAPDAEKCWYCEAPMAKK